MGKSQKKTGKGRIDKFYKLAKEQGYRARSAFKLIQLNKKYNFLESARCCIDLCAAPGGWLQVASKYMPPSSIIVGIDLVPIKPIPRVTTFAADITTPQCRTHIRSTLKDWKADVVLHDGAPNVGTAWVQDAYAQSELVLMSLRLAVEFLIKGGTFITKVFRSKDYNNLMWVFGRLFGSVEATKPPASRNVSAEIFVVCRNFHAPKYIDPKFLDPKHVFKDLDITDAGTAVDKGTSANNAHANVFMPEKKRRQREGYNDGDYTLYRLLPAKEFIYGSDAVGLLGTANRITFDTEEEKKWQDDEDITSKEVKANCNDLKVLGKGDFKVLMKWRSALRQELGLENKTKPTEEFTQVVTVSEDMEVDEETQIQEELERLTAEAAAKAKRERRKANEKKTRNIQRMQLQMTAPLDIGLEVDDPRLDGKLDAFDLGAAEKSGGLHTLDAFESASDDDLRASEDESEGNLGSEEEREQRLGALEDDLDNLYHEYKRNRSERDAKFKATEARKTNKDREETWGGIRDTKNEKSDYSGSDSEDEGSIANGGWEEMQKRKLDTDEDVTSDDDSTADTGSESPGIYNQRKRKRDEGTDRDEPHKRSKLKTTPDDKALNGKPTNRHLLTKLEDPKEKAMVASRASQIWFSQDIFSDVNRLTNVASDSEAEKSGPGLDEESTASENGATKEDLGYDIVPLQQDSDEDVTMWDVDDEDIDAQKEEYIKQYGLNTAEAMTLAQQLVNREKTKTHLINDGFSRYSLNSKEGLPSWFLEDEAKHYKPNIPITKEAVRALREKQRQLDARPIKKVAEAKARKKLKASQRLEKAMKKAEGVNQTSDMTEKEKAAQIEKLMRHGYGKGKKGKKDEVKLVVAKGANRGIQGRPKGVKGRYRMVDRRGKKELRAQKRREKAHKSKRK